MIGRNKLSDNAPTTIVLRVNRRAGSLGFWKSAPGCPGNRLVRAAVGVKGPESRPVRSSVGAHLQRKPGPPDQRPVLPHAHRTNSLLRLHQAPGRRRPFAMPPENEPQGSIHTMRSDRKAISVRMRHHPERSGGEIHPLTYLIIQHDTARRKSLSRQPAVNRPTSTTMGESRSVIGVAWKTPIDRNPHRFTPVWPPFGGRTAGESVK